MKLTKYEHACFTVEKDGQIVIVDPGVFSSTLPELHNVAGIVITHQHEDHFDPDVLAAIYNNNPDSVLVSLQSIIEKMPDHPSRAVSAGDTIKIGPFLLSFFGEKHAEIHSSIPLVDNVGVLIDDTLYYPGDSFTRPQIPVTILALPASGPWFKTSDAIDFLLDVKPARAFATHNIHNSEPGQTLFNRIIGGFTDRAGTEYAALDIGQSIEI